VLQCVAVCCSVLQSKVHTVSVLTRQETCMVVCCSVLPCVAVRCSLVQSGAFQGTHSISTQKRRDVYGSVLQSVAVCCRVLSCVAVWCSVLQCVAVRCSALQCVAVCCVSNYAQYQYSVEKRRVCECVAVC